MAQFYQDPNPTSDPDYAKASREPDRVQADTSMGSLFEGIGNTVNNAGKAATTIFDTKINNDAREATASIIAQHGGQMDEETAKEFAGTGAKGRVRALQMRGGTGAVEDDQSGVLGFAPQDASLVQQQTAGIFDQVAPKALPTGATQELSTLTRFNNAYKSGDLSDSAYNAQMSATASKLRARYPGFEDEVDAAISKLTGIQPANALRKSLMQDIQYNQSAMLQGQTADQKYLDTNAGAINAMGIDPKKVPMDQVRAAVNDWKGTQATLEAKQLRANVGSPEAEAALSDTIAARVQSSITAQHNAAQGGMTISDAQKEAQRMTLAGGGSQKEIDALVNNLSLGRQALATSIQQEVYKPIAGRQDGRNLVTLVKDGDQKLATILQTQLKPYDDMIALAKAGNMSALQASTAAIKEQSNQDVMNLNRAFPQARVGAAINTVFPNNPIMANRFIETSNILPDWQKAIKNGVGNAILNGSKDTPAPTPSQALNSYGPEASKSAAAARETVKQYNLVISPENKQTDNAAHVAKQFFKDTAFYDNLNDSGRLKLFMTMAAPEKTAFINKLAANDPEVATQYKQWASYAASDIWRRNSDTLQSYLVDKSFDIQYNAKTGFFEDHTSYAQPGKTTGGPQPQRIGMMLQSVNNAITIMKPIVGDKPEELLNSMGINPHAEKEDGLVKRMFNALGDKLQDWTTSGQREDIKSGTRKAGDVSLAKPVEGGPEQNRGVIQGNLSDSTILNMETTSIPDNMSAREFITQLKLKHKL